jgi:hypothetical protein
VLLFFHSVFVAFSFLRSSVFSSGVVGR